MDVDHGQQRMYAAHVSVFNPHTMYDYVVHSTLNNRRPLPSPRDFWMSIGQVLNAELVTSRTHLPKKLYHALTPVTPSMLPAGLAFLVDRELQQIVRAQGSYFPPGYPVHPILAVPRNVAPLDVFSAHAQEPFTLFAIESKKKLAKFIEWYKVMQERLMIAHAMGDFGDALITEPRSVVQRRIREAYTAGATPQEALLDLLANGKVYGLPATHTIGVGTFYAEVSCITYEY
jgi:hypothetical protein